MANQLAVMFAVGVFLVGGSVQAAPLAEHSGSTDPVTEGWVFNDYNGGTGVQSSGVDTEAHWNIHRDAGAAGRYIYDLAPSSFTDPTGWTATARAKAVTSANIDDAAFGVFDGTSRWGIHLFASGAWSQTPSWGLGAQLSTDDATAAYHTYQMYFDPAGDGGNGTVDYYSDGNYIGTSKRTDVPALGGVYRIDFGDNNGGGESESKWSSVSFEVGNHVIPEPTSLAIGLAASMLLVCRRRIVCEL